MIFKDVHDPIIDKASWHKVRHKRGKTRNRKSKEGEQNMFSGLLVRADCWSDQNFHFNHGNAEIKYFNCSNHNNRGTCLILKT